MRNGLALDWSRYSKGKYDAAQRDAEHAGRGIWEGTYVEPWLFRVRIRQGGRPGDCSDDANAHLLMKVRPQIAPGPFALVRYIRPRKNLSTCFRSSEEERWYRPRNQRRLGPMDSPRRLCWPRYACSTLSSSLFHVVFSCRM